MARYHDLLCTLDDPTPAAVAEALGSESVDVHRFAQAMMTIMQREPLLALRAIAWLIGAAERSSDFVPDGALAREEWLRLHNNACYLAIHAGAPEERRAVVVRAMRVATENIAIFHNAACVWCALGEAELAIEAVRSGVRAGLDEASIASIRSDSDLALVLDHPEFLEALEGRGEFRIPSWAAHFSPGEFTQFREAVRTSLRDPDMSRFAEGVVVSQGNEHAVRELAARCEGLDPFAIVRTVVAGLT